MQEKLVSTEGGGVSVLTKDAVSLVGLTKGVVGLGRKLS